MRLDDGHSTIITFSEAPTLRLYEKGVTPPGISAGGEVDTTTMRNTTWRTRSPKQLKTLTNSSATVAYDTDAIDDIIDMIGVNQIITITHPDGATISFYGWLDTFEPGENTEGEQPTATITIIPSNHDNSSTQEESDPVTVNAGGTT